MYVGGGESVIPRLLDIREKKKTYEKDGESNREGEILVIRLQTHLYSLFICVLSGKYVLCMSVESSNRPIKWSADYLPIWDNWHRPMPALMRLINKKCLQTHLEAALSV